MIPPVVRSLTLQRFRSFPLARIELDNPTFLVGPNGSGKSNLVDALAFFSEAMMLPLEAVFEKRGGPSLVLGRSPGPVPPSRLGLGVTFGQLDERVAEGSYAFEVDVKPRHAFEVVREQCRVRTADGGHLWFERDASRFRSNVRGLEPALDPAALGLPLIGGDARFAPVVRTLAAVQVHSIEPAGLRDRQESNGSWRLRRDGANCAGILREIAEQAPQDMDRICEVLATIVPDVTRVEVKEQGNKLSLEFLQEWEDQQGLRFEAASMSDGTLRALGLLTAVYQQPAPSVLTIEEPEATIHAHAIGAVLDLLRHAARNLQVVVTTHSPELLDGDWIDDRHLRMVEWSRGATRVSGVSDVTRQALRQHVMGVGELLRSNALDGVSPVPDERLTLFEDLSG